MVKNRFFFAKLCYDNFTTFILEKLGMKKSFALTALACASLVLTACGSSGGSLGSTTSSLPKTTSVIQQSINSNTNQGQTSGNVQNTQNTQNIGNQNSTQQNSGTQNIGNQNSGNVPNSLATGVFGQIAIVDINNHSISGIKRQDVRSSEVSKISVNGKEYNLLKSYDPEYVQKGNFGDILYYGYADDKDDKPTGREYAFYQGQLTKDMPTTGKATYLGNVIYACQKCDDEILRGSANFQVDFGAKKLTGNLSDNGVRLGVSANINGNKFSGDHADGTRVDGAFFGDNASHLGGLFENKNVNGAGHVGGSFGASKIALP